MPRPFPRPGRFIHRSIASGSPRSPRHAFGVEYVGLSTLRGYGGPNGNYPFGDPRRHNIPGSPGSGLGEGRLCESEVFFEGHGLFPLLRSRTTRDCR
jgi:hypothetical protein